MHRPISMQSVETKASWTIATVVLVILTLSFGAPWITIVALKPIAAETAGLRSVPALATSLAWIGFGAGGIAMGYVAEKIGVRWTVIFGAVMIWMGLALSTGGETWHLYVGQGLFVGFLGIGGMNAPFYVYVSRWFDRRRGSALALISSGSYLAGAIWPSMFERAITYAGWRQTMFYYGLLEVVLVVPLAAIFLRQPPELALPEGAFGTSPAPKTVMGWPPNLVFGLVAAAVIFCCIPMAMPQAHLPALCSDLGILASHGAAMLSVLLGTAFISRQFWGWVSDRAGGLNTVLIGSSFQIIAMTAFMLTQDEVGLVHRLSRVWFGICRHHPGLHPGHPGAVSGVGSLLADSDVPVVQRRRHGHRRLDGRRTLRSLRHLRAGIRRRRWRQCRQSGDRRAAGVPAATTGVAVCLTAVRQRFNLQSDVRSNRSGAPRSDPSAAAAGSSGVICH